MDRPIPLFFSFCDPFFFQNHYFLEDFLNTNTKRTKDDSIENRQTYFLLELKALFSRDEPTKKSFQANLILKNLIFGNIASKNSTT